MAIGAELAFHTNGVKLLSWEPRVFLWRKFLSEEECDHILSKSAHLVSRSKVATQGNDPNMAFGRVKASAQTFIY